MSDLLPKLSPIKVDPQKLYLDPNNPRFITRDEDRIDQERFLDPDIIERTRKLMRGDKDTYDIDIIKASISTNGWQPVDCIFVRKFKDDQERYVVIEGNRRIVAIKELLEDTDTSAEIRSQLKQIEVMEVTDKIDKRKPAKSERELRKKISYLLGVRHHGSLKKWSPFARAANIYQKYLSIAGQTDANFHWKDEITKEIAETLSMEKKEVKKQIQVFRAMKQIGETPAIKASEEFHGGMKDSYYSLCEEVLLGKGPGLKEYISQDQSSFLLNNTSLDKMILLCRFDKPGREGSPINRPQQWRFLDKILRDDDLEKRAANLRRVEIGNESPEDVWAEREQELIKPDWASWLNQVARICQGLTLARIDVNENSKAVMMRLTKLLTSLGDK